MADPTQTQGDDNTAVAVQNDTAQNQVDELTQDQPINQSQPINTEVKPPQLELQPQDTPVAVETQSTAGPVLNLRSNPEGDNEQNIEDINLEFKESDLAMQAKELGIKYINLQNFPISRDALYLTEKETVQKTKACPFSLIGKKVSLATVDPNSEGTKQEVIRLKNKRYEPELYICSNESLQYALELLNQSFAKKEVEVETHIDEENLSTAHQEIQNLFLTPEEVSQKSAPELLNIINLGSIKTKASDIHIQPSQNKIILRMRIDGILQNIFDIPEKNFKEISTEIKRVSKLKINVTNIPQDGQYSFTVNDRRINVRVSTMPTRYGESIVLRILDSKKTAIDLEQLGYSNSQLQIINRAVSLTSGLILSTGPTGSGKTTTLYALLNKINSTESKVVTLEDPVEYEVSTITQSEINETNGYTFEMGLKSMLRQDPDVVMIGEIRDITSAETAVQASLTGHIVLSTLHSNSAIDTILRLQNIGVKSYVLAPSLQVIMAQRLVRKVCTSCVTDGELSEKQRQEIEEVIADLKKDGFQIDWQIPETTKKKKGCDDCSQTGYVGREVIAEVLEMSEEVRNAILREEGHDKMFKLARSKGFITMKEEGMRKVLEGKTTFEEVWRVSS
jgi:type IV pilus assembly protein PilB